MKKILFVLSIVFSMLSLTVYAQNPTTAKEQLEKGENYYKAGNYNEAFKWYMESAKQGYAEGQLAVGACFENGYGVSKNLTEAMKWYRKAAEQGILSAQLRMALAYKKGEGVSKDDTEAFRWLLKAAEQNDEDAQLQLALSYYTGTGTDKNIDEAFKWIGKAAEQGYSNAQIVYGHFYENGIGTETNLNEAIKWYKKAAAQGQEHAKQALKRLEVNNTTNTANNNSTVNRNHVLDDESLVLYLPFNNGSYKDESGHNNNAYNQGNGGLRFYGIHGDDGGATLFGGCAKPGCIIVKNSESLKISDGWTFAAFIQPSKREGMDGYGNASADGVNAIFAKSHDRNGFTIFYSLSGGKFNTWLGGSGSWTRDIGASINGDYINKWVHVAYVYEKGEFRIYLNGIKTTTKKVIPDFSAANSQDLYLGKFSDRWYPMAGAIDEVRIYNRALNDEEISEIAKL